MVEQGGYIVVDDEEIVDALYGGMTEAHPIDCGCAWCLAEAGQDMGRGSHSICKYHAEEQYEKFRASRHAA